MNALKEIKIIKKGIFEKHHKFEERLNDYLTKGYLIVNITGDHSTIYALIGKPKL